MELKNKNIILRKKVGVVDKYNFFEYLSVMLDGGVTISEALESVETKVRNEYFRQKIKELSTFISSGDSMSKSMKKLPQIFNSAEISIIEAGESTGRLGTSLASLSNNLRKTHDLQSKVKNALTYPAIIFLFLLVAVIVVLTFVIPAITPLFENSEVELPAATKALVATSDFIRYNYIILILFLVTAYVLFWGYKESEKGRANIDMRLLRIPLVGTVYKNYILSGISANLGNLIASGVPVVRALTLVGKSSNNMVYESLMMEVTQKVSEGNKIVDSM